MKTAKVILVFLMLFASKNTLSQVWIEGGAIDCGQWVSVRKANRSVAFENYVLGMLNGLASGENKEFWRAKGQPVSREAVYLWMDTYCQSHPLEGVVAAVHLLFRERTSQESK